MKHLHRDQRGLSVFETLWQDVRYGARQLRKNPGFTATAVFTLALGIGAATAVFSLINPLLIRPLPFREPDRLVWVANALPGSSSLSAATTRAGTFADWQSQNTSFERLGAYFAFFDYGSQTLAGTGEPVRLQGVGVSQDFLDTLGVRPRLGRNFSAEECQWNGPKAVMLSDGLWKRRFGADPSIVGQTISLRDDLIAVATGGQAQTEAYVVAGVLPSTFDFASLFTPAVRVDFLMPFSIGPQTDRWGNTLAAIGRLKPGVSLAQARSEFEVLNDRIKKAHPERGTDFTAVMMPLSEHVSGSYRRPFLILVAAVASVLLIVCANLSNLLLSRAATRRKEIAVRLALGSGRVRLIRQMLTESILLAGCGSLFGLPLAYLATRMLAQTRAFDVPMLSSVRVDAQALGFMVTVALACGILFGMVPALRLSRSELHGDLNDAGRGSTHGKSHSKVSEILVALEVAATCVLIVAAGLLVRSLVSMLEVDPGFRPEMAATWRIEPSRSFTNPQEQTAYFRALVDTMEGLPGVESAGLSDSLPMGRNRSWNVQAKGVIYRPGESPEALPRIVDENYLQTMKIPLRSGRYLERDDLTRGKRVVVINEALALRLWPGATAVGKMVLTNGEAQVVGVVGNVHHAGLDRAAEPEMYFLGGQNGWSTEDLVVRTKASLETLEPAVRGALREFDPGMPTGEFRTLGEIVDQSVSPKRLITALLGSFSLLAMLLASVGIYGVIVSSVNQRTSELGIRVAFGATARDIHRLVIGEGMRPVFLGLAVGVVLALVLTQIMRSLLFGVSATDPLTFAVDAVMVTSVGLLACYLPARRAAKVDPMVALRYE